MIFGKSRAQIRNETATQLKSGGNITNLSRGSQARALLDIFSDQTAELYQSLEANLAQGFVDTAQGKYLNLIGNMFGISRRAATTAIVTPADRAIRFYSADGSPLAVHIPTKVIPANTTIQTSDGSITYLVTADTAINDVQTEVFVGAAAQSAGTSSNVGENVLTEHSLGVSDVLVTNPISITGGSSVENDEDFRFRVANAALLNQTSNRTALRTAALALPGVADVQVREFPSGVGTVQLLLIPSGNRVPQTSLAIASQVVSTVRAAGVRVQVREPSFVPVSISLQLVFRAGATQAEREFARQRTPAAIFDVIDDIPLGGLLVINRLRAAVLDVSSSIEDLRIHCLNIRKRPQLLRNFRLFDDELFIPDPDVDEPVRIL